MTNIESLELNVLFVLYSIIGNLTILYMNIYSFKVFYFSLFLRTLKQRTPQPQLYPSSTTTFHHSRPHSPSTTAVRNRRPPSPSSAGGSSSPSSYLEIPISI
ncbi:hypothetical protein RND81_06G090000 [Saponaria officinalis]|uniref:Uncharacterized protein n=1 Tax=Saponaria officinalis TaxID=3572 RepID=A0AAW1KAV1_SAPOF